MQTGHPRKRFTESLPGMAAAFLLGVIWIASMGAVDSFAYTAGPYLALLCLVVLLWLSGVLFGCKIVRLRFLSWCSLAAGAFFLIRCHLGQSLVESWGESALVAGCVVFYIAGIYAAQGERVRGVVTVISAALLANLLWRFLPLWDMPYPFLLRPDHGVCGPAAGYSALFTYKNFAGFFLLTVGALPLCNLIFRSERGVGVWGSVLVGLLAMAVSFGVGTRSVVLLLPALVIGLWLLWLVAVLLEVRRCSLLFIGIGCVLFLSAFIAFYDFLFGRSVIGLIQGTDTHLRGMAWGIICRVAPEAPLWGFGPRATQWEIAQYFNDWCTPNMAHNEYLQAWMDYGIIGLGLMTGILLVHLTAGFRQLVSEHIGGGRRVKVGMALLYLFSSLIYAAWDFGWHQVALAGGAAFACGVLASPYPARPWRWRELGRNWAPESRPKPTPVCTQGAFGKLLLVLLASGMGGYMADRCRLLAPAWLASWQYSQSVHAPDRSFAAERQLMENVFASYPDSKLTDAYVRLPMPAPADLPHLENMFRTTLAANPKQAFTAVMLVDILGRQGRFEEAELTMRRLYVGDGPNGTRTTSWPFYYGYNLIRWGQREMYRGNSGTALSMLEHGFAVLEHSGTPGTAYRTGFKPWEQGETARFRETVKKLAKSDLEMLRAMGVSPDDSWRQPMEQGGKAALYSRWMPER